MPDQWQAVEYIGVFVGVLVFAGLLIADSIRVVNGESPLTSMALVALLFVALGVYGAVKR